jgi:hypothetical protein
MLVHKQKGVVLIVNPKSREPCVYLFKSLNDVPPWIKAHLTSEAKYTIAPVFGPEMEE